MPGPSGETFDHQVVTEAMLAGLQPNTPPPGHNPVGNDSLPVETGVDSIHCGGPSYDDLARMGGCGALFAGFRLGWRAKPMQQNQQGEAQ